MSFQHAPDMMQFGQFVMDIVEFAGELGCRDLSVPRIRPASPTVPSRCPLYPPSRASLTTVPIRASRAAVVGKTIPLFGRAVLCHGSNLWPWADQFLHREKS